MTEIASTSDATQDDDDLFEMAHELVCRLKRGWGENAIDFLFGDEDATTETQTLH